jgi:hypothetical protein
VRETDKMETIYVSDFDRIWRNAPSNLEGDALQAGIDEQREA